MTAASPTPAWSIQSSASATPVRAISDALCSKTRVLSSSAVVATSNGRAAAAEDGLREAHAPAAVVEAQREEAKRPLGADCHVGPAHLDEEVREVREEPDHPGARGAIRRLSVSGSMTTSAIKEANEIMN